MALRRQTPEELAAWRARSKPMKKGKGLKQGKGLKKTPMKRRSSLPRKYRPSEGLQTAAQIKARKEFHDAAKAQGVCAVCGRADSWDAHHVIEKSWLKANHKPLFVAANSLRVCDQYAENDCHGRHTRRSKKIKLTMLTDRNVQYAFALQGAKAWDYLRRIYAGSDPRVTELAKEYGAI